MSFMFDKCKTSSGQIDDKQHRTKHVQDIESIKAALGHIIK